MPVADPGGGGNSQSGCANLLFCKFVAENCMKMKEFGPRGGHASLTTPPLGICQWTLLIIAHFQNLFMITFSQHMYFSQIVEYWRTKRLSIVELCTDDTRYSFLILMHVIEYLVMVESSKGSHFFL